MPALVADVFRAHVPEAVHTGIHPEFDQHLQDSLQVQAITMPPGFHTLEAQECIAIMDIQETVLANP